MINSFVLGNGRSRLNIAPSVLKPYGKIYGCNALYREFIPDYLIAVDQKMIFEIQERNIQEITEVWTNSNPFYKNGFYYFSPPLKWSSGPCALNLASTHVPDNIYILGFDYTGINGKVNNVYTDTPNYNSSNDGEIYWGNWEKQTELVIRSNPNINYIRVVDENFYDTGWSYDNFKIMKYDDFFALLQNSEKIA